MTQQNTRDIRLIGFDLDGTIVHDFSHISPRVKQAIERAAAAGVEMVPATGRQLVGIPPEVLAIPGIRYVLTANGALVYDLAGQNGPVELYADRFSNPQARAVLRVLKRYHSLLGMYTGGRGYNEEMTGEFARSVPEEMMEYMRTTRSFVKSLDDVLRESGLPVEKFTMFFTSEAERERAWRELSARGDSCTTSSLSMNLEVNTPTANKGAGLLALGQKLGYTRRQVMALGDGSNDIEMLRAVGYGVAMGNAGPNVKAAADAVTRPCAEDGAADAIDTVLAWRAQLFGGGAVR